jgi:bla regulator protein blaR1
MNRKHLHASFAFVLACCAFGQTPSFDVVSIKPNKSGSGSSSSNTHNGVLTGTNISLKNFIMRAYRMLDYQISGPEWLQDERFDIAAKPPAGGKEEDFPLMMRSMLADRFKLEAHKDTKVFPVYGLVAGKGGLKTEPVKDEGGNNMNSSRGYLKCERCSMAAVAGWLARQMDRPVVDMTELPGVYNLVLNFTPENAEPLKEDGAKKEVYPPLLTAIQEQWGLKLEPKKAPLEILVIDHVEKIPSEN